MIAHLKSITYLYSINVLLTITVNYQNTNQNLFQPLSTKYNEVMVKNVPAFYVSLSTYLNNIQIMCSLGMTIKVFT